MKTGLEILTLLFVCTLVMSGKIDAVIALNVLAIVIVVFCLLAIKKDSDNSNNNHK